MYMYPPSDVSPDVGNLYVTAHHQCACQIEAVFGVRLDKLMVPGEGVREHLIQSMVKLKTHSCILFQITCKGRNFMSSSQINFLCQGVLLLEIYYVPSGRKVDIREREQWRLARDKVMKFGKWNQVHCYLV